MFASGDFKSVQDSIQQSLVATTRSATSLSTQDLAFHRSLDPKLAKALDRQNARLLGLAERLLGNAAGSGAEIVRPARLRDAEAIETGWRGIVDVVDSLLEKADISLDEYTGAVKRLSPGTEQVSYGEYLGHVERCRLTDKSQTPSRMSSPKPSRIAQALRSQDIPKPQLLFQHVPTNAEKHPFKPLLKSKPHASIPFEQTKMLVKKDQDKENSTTEHYPHPYQQEIMQYQYPPSVYTEAEPIPYLPYESTTATFVNTEEALQEMLNELKGAKEIAVDLEHHDQRSYIGIVSLMQISTRNKDWVVDTLQPWRRKLSCLNDVFADPQIVKVLHGAFMDIMWLQRDLGIYVVGLFDTHYAAKALGYSGGSLAFLLKKFADFDAQKQYQTADWRIRPLPEEMFNYARSDTHFLLYIFDNMRNELIQKSDFSVPNHEKDKINDVLVKSKDTALQRYEHPIYDAKHGRGPMGWYKMLSRTPALFSKEQFAVFRALHHWRDNVAREQDDSVHYIMANHNVFSIAKEMPTEKAALLSVAQPASQTVKLRADEVVAVISKAKSSGANGPDMMETLKEIEFEIYGPGGAPYRSAASYKQTPVAVTAAAAAAVPDATAGAAPETNRIANDKAQALRSATSLFWGSAFSSPNPQQKRKISTHTLNLSVPLPALTAAVFAEQGAFSEQPQPAQTPTPIVTTSPLPTPRHDDDGSSSNKPFTLKELSRKRKSDAISTSAVDIDDIDDSLATNADEVDIPDSDTDIHALKREAKKAKKAERLARKEAESARVERERLEEEEFDYEGAPSVLNRVREEEARERRERMAGGGKGKGKSGKDKGKGGKEKVFDPYKKALDTGKGLPRAQRERAGRSMTFKK